MCPHVPPPPLSAPAELDAIFGRANDSVIEALHRLLPLDAHEHLREALFAEAERAVVVEGADLDALAAANDAIHRGKSGWAFCMCARVELLKAYALRTIDRFY